MESWRSPSLPDSATCEMSTPCSAAMKPRIEKTTKPAKKLVPLFIRAKMQASLQETRSGASLIHSHQQDAFSFAIERAKRLKRHHYFNISFT